jgi:Co/Zn/Cd efflux system component
VTPEEQLIIDQISWDITSWYATTKQLFEETKSAKEEIEKMRKTLKNLKDRRKISRMKAWNMQLTVPYV